MSNRNTINAGRYFFLKTKQKKIVILKRVCRITLTIMCRKILLRCLRRSIKQEKRTFAYMQKEMTEDNNVITH